MSTYLLLRDNKQHGPLSLEEMKAKGLKAYDLVWVEGKSAAWRYPGEVEELKPFAPAVVEQPFDRFFKKPAPSEDRMPDAEKQPALAQKPRAQSQETGQVTLPPTKKNIYVTLPAAYTSAGVRESVKEVDFSRQNTSAPAGQIQREADPGQRPPEQSILANGYTATAAAPYQHVSHPGNPPAVLRFGATRIELDRAGKTVLLAAVVLILVGMGILIGLQINNRPIPSDKSNDVPARVQPLGSNLTTNYSPDNTLPPASQPGEGGNGTGEDPALPGLNHSGALAAASARKTPVEKLKNQASKPKDEMKVAQPSPPVKLDSASNLTESAAPRREAIHRSDNNNDKDIKGISLFSLVGVSTGKYTVGTFGGISDLQVTVTNRSPHPLDLVVVEIQYIQANKKIFKTENLYFRNIGPGSALMQEAPKSPRGIRIEYKVTLINTKDSGLSYSSF